jgi:hypothetical protein
MFSEHQYIEQQDQIICTKSIIFISKIESMKELASLPFQPSSQGLLLKQHFQTGI